MRGGGGETGKGPNFTLHEIINNTIKQCPNCDLVVAANDLRWVTTGVFKPFVEIWLFGPQLQDRKRREATKQKPNMLSPKIGEQFVFLLGSIIIIRYSYSFFLR